MSPVGCWIDKLTQSIEDVSTGISLQTSVLPFEFSDLSKVLKKNGWSFNWKKEYGLFDRRIYKLLIEGDSVIQGLISLQKIENYIEMYLIESAPHNIGKTKKYAGVPGNLVAFACKMSYDLGCEGYVAFTPKSRLIEHYINSLGASLIFRNRMCISGDSARNLVNLYYKNYLHGK
jgi:hypothetical protein